MRERTKFWILLGILMLSVALLLILNNRASSVLFL